MSGILLRSHLPFYLNSVMVLAHIYATEYYNQPFMFLLIFYSIIPFVDQFIPDDFSNPTPEEAKVLKQQIKWSIPIYIYIFLEWFTLFWAFHYVTRPDITIKHIIVATLSLGQISSFGFLFGHELMHKRNAIVRTIGVLDMLKNLYLHFYSEHLLGHHKNIATPTDPATSKYNQTLYDFVSNTIYASFANTWNREKKIMIKSGRSAWSIHNRMIQWISIEILFTIAIWKLWGALCLIVFLVQAIYSILILETVNYIRHYGLLRKKLENGKYEPVTTKHSWNAPQTLQNIVLIKLQRHSDHHAHSHKPYQVLLNCEDSPNLPCGYNVCILAAFIPSVWFGLINPLADSTNNDGKPTPDQLAKSTSVMKSWLMMQLPVITLLAYVLS